MRISFDIDDTLAGKFNELPEENSYLPGFLHKRFCEPLRFGTCSVMQELRRRGWSIWIYTTSLRPAWQVRLWLLLHGIRVDGVVNDDKHRRKLANRNFSSTPSKFPPAFGIDLHVDDSEGVRMEGETHGFKVLILEPSDTHWTKKVLDVVSRMDAKGHTEF